MVQSCIHVFDCSYFLFALLQIALKEVMPLYETLFDNVIRWKENEVHKYFHELEVSENENYNFLQVHLSSFNENLTFINCIEG